MTINQGSVVVADAGERAADQGGGVVMDEQDKRVVEVPWITWGVAQEAWQFMRDAIRQMPDGTWYFSGTGSTIDRSVKELESLLWDCRPKPKDGQR